MRGVMLPLLSVLATGCPAVGAYFCRGADDCDRGGQAGVCLDDNSCAYPDATGTCASGLVRSPNADRAPGQCVPAETDGDSDTTDGGTVAQATGSDDATTSDDNGLGACGRVTVTVDPNAIATDQALPGYPLLLRVTEPAVVSALHHDGWFATVTDATGAALAVEIATADAEPGAWLAWVALPQYTAGQPFALHVQWGTTPSTSPPTSVWSARYRGVWHMDDALTGDNGDTIANSVVPGEPGLTEGTMQPAQSLAATIGKGLSFDGDNDGVVIEAAFLNELDAYTISMWTRYEGTGAADEPRTSYFQRLNGDFFYPRCWRQESGSVFCQFRMVPEAIVGASGDFVHNPGASIHLVLSRDAGAAQTSVYVDGILRGVTDEGPGTLAGGRLALEIGRGEWGTARATIDEVRVSDQALPAEWIAADYATQVDPGAAIDSVSAIESLPCD